MTISEKLQLIKNSTDDIKNAIQEIGGIIQGDITTWADVIRSCKPKQKQINKLTIFGNSITSEFPVASDLTINVYGRPTGSANSSMPTDFNTFIYKGTNTNMANIKTLMSINSVEPSEDDTYIYTFDES